MERMMKPEMRAAVSQAVKKCGFTYVSLDLDGYVQGSLNKELQRKPGGREFP
jgi:PP-loop superfamily ATP-utilizing enzyme